MKRISQSKSPFGGNHRHLSLFLASLLLVQLTSCSWVTSRRSLFGNDEEEEEKATASVPRAQYDDLKRKYDQLMRDKKIERVESPSSANNMLNEMEKDPSEVVNELANVSETGELAETVDVFGKDGVVGKRPAPRPMAPVSNTIPAQYKKGYTGALVEDHISKLRKGERFLRQKKLDQALTIFKELDKSPVRQIVVRSKFYIGEILFMQGEYDLAMQIYEEVLTKHAFSGIVLKTLGRLIVCSEKLKIDSKKEKYYSILHDFFEQGV